MTSILSKTVAPLLLVLGANLATPAQAEDLRIGFIAPMTGLFAQVGKDMNDGFQLYLDEHGNKLGGMDVKFILEDDQAKPDLGVTKAKKLILQDKVNMFIGGVLASTGYALAPVSTAEKTIYIPSIPASDDLTQREAGKYPYYLDPHRSWSSSQPHHALGAWACEQGPTRKSSRSVPTMRSDTRRSAVSRKRSRIAAARSSRKSGRRSATRISDRSSRPSRRMPTRCSR